TSPYSFPTRRSSDLKLRVIKDVQQHLIIFHIYLQILSSFMETVISQMMKQLFLVLLFIMENQLPLLDINVEKRRKKIFVVTSVRSEEHTSELQSRFD